MNKGLLALFLVCLSISSLTGFELVNVLATPAPSRNTTIEPGWAGYCTDILYIDGTTPVDHPTNGAPNTVGTIGQDFGAFVNANINSNKDYCLEAGTFSISTPINMKTDVNFQGVGNATYLSCTLDCFNFPGVGTIYTRMVFKDFTVPAAGGDVFDFGQAKIQYSKFYQITMGCASTGRTCFRLSVGGGMVFNHFYELTMTGGASNTVSIMNFTDNNNGGINANTFGPRLTFSNSGTWAITVDEMSASTQAVGNTFTDITGDPVVGGLLACYSCTSTYIDKPSVYDTVAPTHPMIFISKHGGNSHDTTIVSAYSLAGTASQPDIQLDGNFAPSGAVIIEPTVNYLDVGNTPSVTIILSNTQVTVNLLQISQTTFIIQDGRLTSHLAAAATSQKAETGADATVLSYTPLPIIGSYQACITLSISAANTATIGWTATWTDSNGNAQTPTNLALFQSGTAAPALTFTTSVAGNYYACANIDVNNAAVAIVIKTTFSGTSIAYKVSATIMRLQ